jgi:hypothetical protein
MNTLLRTIVFAFMLLLAPAATMADQRVGGSVEAAAGNTHGDEVSTTGVSTAIWNTASDVVGWHSMSKRFFGKNIGAAFQNETNKNKAHGSIKLNNKTVMSTSGKSSKSWGPYLLEYKTPKFTLSLGWVTLTAYANLGGGAQAGLTYDYGTSPLMAKLNGACQGWAFGAASFGVSILAGLAEAKLKIEATFFNSTLHLALEARQGQPLIANARIDYLPWTIKAKVKAELLGVTVHTSTLVEREGSTKTRQLL